MPRHDLSNRVRLVAKFERLTVECVRLLARHRRLTAKLERVRLIKPRVSGVVLGVGIAEEPGVARCKGTRAGSLASSTCISCSLVLGFGIAEEPGVARCKGTRAGSWAPSSSCS